MTIKDGGHMLDCKISIPDMLHMESLYMYICLYFMIIMSFVFLLFFSQILELIWHIRLLVAPGGSQAIEEP